jgi:biotin operon repressor
MGGKLGAMLETSARLLRLLSLLQARRDWSGAELADRLGVSTRTVRRDVERLRSLGYPVHATSGTAGGYRLGAGAVLPPLLLDDDEAVAVAVGLRTAAGGSVAGIEETSVRALAKLEQVLPSRLRYRVNALWTSTVPVPGDGPTVDAEVLTAIAGACGSTIATMAEQPASAPWSRTAWCAGVAAGTCSHGTPTGGSGGASASTAFTPARRPARGSPPATCPTTRSPPMSPAACGPPDGGIAPV